MVDNINGYYDCKDSLIETSKKVITLKEVKKLE